MWPFIIDLFNEFLKLQTVMNRILSVIFILLTKLVIFSDAHAHAEVLTKLIKCGFNPTQVVDVGANMGDWTTGMQGIFRGAHFFMIEGDSKHIPKLKQIMQPFEIALVAEIEKNVTFYAISTVRGTGNSLFEENTDAPREKISRTAYTIDSILKKRGIASPQLLKLDIQGSELNALKGASETLKTVEVIVSEVSVMNYNQGKSL